MSDTPRRIILRPRVADDLERQVAYLDENANPEVGNRYLDAVNTAFERLAEMPGMGPPRDTINSRLRGLRMWSVPDFPKYLIFYRFTDTALEVIRHCTARRTSSKF